MVTILGKRGEYGGPSTVAQELTDVANQDAGQNFDVSILAGSLDTEIQINQKLSLIPVSKPPIFKSRFFLFSLGYLKEAYIQVKSTDLVHLHFSRELIQVYSGFLCILFRKKFITQTHGMIRPKKSLWLFDFFLIRPVLRKANVNLVLTEEETKAIRKVEKSLNPLILANGTFFDEKYLSDDLSLKSDALRKFRIVFCSRLHHTKGLDIMIEICRQLKEQDLVIDFYGPDYGELEKLQNALNAMEDSKAEFSYKGTINHQNVRNLLKQSDLMILPSEYDPFPMIVLESLSVGTPVLISQNCGQAHIVEKLIANSVCKSNSPEDYSRMILHFKENPLSSRDRNQLFSQAKEVLGIESVWRNLSAIYENAS